MVSFLWCRDGSSLNDVQLASQHNLAVHIELRGQRESGHGAGCMCYGRGRHHGESEDWGFDHRFPTKKAAISGGHVGLSGLHLATTALPLGAAAVRLERRRVLGPEASA